MITTNAITIQIILEGASLFGSGLIAGCAIYVTAIEVVCRQDMSSEYQLENFNQILPTATSFMKLFGIITGALLCCTALVTGNRIWWIPFVLFSAIRPFTILAMETMNGRLMNMSYKGKLGSEKLTNEIASWGRLHQVRTCMALLGFVGAIVASITH